MRFTFNVEVEVERTEGKFAGREELAEQISEALDSANPSSIEGENGGQYDISDWVVEEAHERTWKRTDEDIAALHLMREAGGGFASALAEAAFKADAKNYSTLRGSFAWLFAEYISLNREKNAARLKAIGEAAAAQLLNIEHDNPQPQNPQAEDYER